MPFNKIGLCEELVQGILATGYTAPTEIQAEAIPVAIEGKDMIGCAQTGTGKTAAFVLPILNRIAQGGEKTKKQRLRALILTPTRELAEQIDKSVKGYGRFVKMNSLAIYGGASMEKQLKALRRGVDIIAATPGRLLDHIERGTINLSNIEVLVLDEADRMLDMGFVQDIRKVIDRMPKNRQTLLFSATMSKEVQNLTKNIQRSPHMIQIGRQHNPIETITQHIYPVPADQKMELLLEMIEAQQMYSVLIFSRTKRGADKIRRKLKERDIAAEAIHSDRTQSQRQRALDGFRRGKFQVMVATDIAARGINVEGISHVINYDVPAYAEDYVHRIGRTGRAEATGDAITFVSYDEIPLIKKIERFIDRTFVEKYHDGFAYKTRVSLSNGPKSSKSGGRKRVGSSQRKRAKAKTGAVDGEHKGGKFGKRKKATGRGKAAGSEGAAGKAGSEKTRGGKAANGKGYFGSTKGAKKKRSAEGDSDAKPKSRKKAAAKKRAGGDAVANGKAKKRRVSVQGQD